MIMVQIKLHNIYTGDTTIGRDYDNLVVVREQA